jgi:hypothetical protein
LLFRDFRSLEDSLRPEIALVVGFASVRQGQEMNFEDNGMPADEGVFNLFGAAVLIWSAVIAAAIWMF